MRENMCKECGGMYHTIDELLAHDCPGSIGILDEVVSEVSASVDHEDLVEVKLVEEASQPSLATLFQRAKNRGLIKPTNSYGVPAP